MTFVPQPGDTIGGKYRVVRSIGEGGMGTVFEAENALTRKRIAIKWLHPQSSHREDARARLVREAQASARIRHPNVVDVYDVERVGDAIFLVMELLEGAPLSDALKKRTMAMHELIALLVPAMRGVAAAHQQGVVHRDIKPDNIFLARQADTKLSVPKVLDFGISKLTPRDGEHLSLTRTGNTLGTPLYMSYEQLSGVRDLDGRADIYAFGVILYEGLTGHPPYRADSYSELVMKVATQSPVPPRQLRADIPTPLERLVLWAMAKHRDDRAPSLPALIQELEPFSTEHGFQAEAGVCSHAQARASTVGETSPSPAAAHSEDVLAPTRTRPASVRPTVPDASSVVSAPASATHPALRREGGKRRLPIVLGAGLSMLVAALGWTLWVARESDSPIPASSLPHQPAAATPAAAQQRDTGSGIEGPSLHAADQNAEWEPTPTVQALAPEPWLAPEPALVPAPQAAAAHNGRAKRDGAERQRETVALGAKVEARGAAREQKKAVIPAPLLTPAAEPIPPAKAQQTSEPKHRVNQEPSAEEF